jgi:hypothetical protein
VPRLRVRTVLDAPPEQVWSDIEDIASHVEWMEDAVAIRFLGRARRGVGTRFECDTKIGLFRLTDVMEITSWVPAREMGVRHVGVVTGTGHFALRRASGGRTKLSWTEQLDFPWWMLGPAGALAARPVLRRVWRQNLTNLAARYKLSGRA